MVLGTGMRVLRRVWGYQGIKESNPHQGFNSRCWGRVGGGGAHLNRINSPQNRRRDGAYLRTGSEIPGVRSQPLIQLVCWPPLNDNWRDSAQTSTLLLLGAVNIAGLERY